MLDYLIQLLEDANNFTWDAAKASHAVLLCRMEQGDVQNYMQVDKIDRFRQANAQRHMGGSSLNQNSKFQNKKPTRVTPCLYFNKGSCTHTKSHDTKGILYKHICAACYTTSGRTFPHPETKCRNKTKRNLSKKRINKGMITGSHTRHSRDRYFYTRNNEHAMEECRASKSLVTTWYNRFKTFNNTVSHKTYAQVLLRGVNKDQKQLKVVQHVRLLLLPRYVLIR